MKKKLFLIFSVLSINLNYSQDPINIKSPDIYSFEKYGNIPLNMYTGQIDLQIPLFNIKLNNNTSLKTLLSYDSSGFIPRKKNNSAGINWTLFAGGKITRKINKIADEYKTNMPGNADLDYDGFIQGLRNNPNRPSNQDLYNFIGINHSVQGFYLGDGLTKYESEPDEFYFNILDISGKFSISIDGSVKVESNDPNIKVDLTNFATFGKSSNCIPPSSEIKLTDSKGNIYFFGGDFTKIEIQYTRSNPFGGDKNGYSMKFPIINALSISKIILSESNEEINFTYYDFINPSTDFCQAMTTRQERIISENPIIFSIESFFSMDDSSGSLTECYHGSNNCSDGNGSFSNYNTSYTLIKKSVLKNILYNNYNISFDYYTHDYSISHHSFYNRLNPNETSLKKVQLNYNNNLINEINFEYLNLGGTNKRSFLSKIKLYNNSEYIFEYYNTNSLPNYYTFGIDHWGYWNGDDNANTLIPNSYNYNHNTGDYELLDGSYRSPNPEKFNTALLKKIIYPTKGYSVFEYEVPEYSKRVERNSTSNFFPSLNNVNGIIGGARLRSKIDYNHNGIVAKDVRYKYTTTLNGSESSGILLNWPRYITHFQTINNQVERNYLFKTSSNIQVNSLDSYNIGYSKIFEIEDNNGYTEYCFYNYEDIADNINSIYNSHHAIDNNTTYLPPNLWKYMYFKPIDKSNMRGLLKKASYFNNSNILVRSDEYSYTNNENFEGNVENFVTNVSGFYGAIHANKTFYNKPLTKQKITREFSRNNFIETIENYTYDNIKRQIKNIEIIIPNNIILKEVYKYPYDFNDDISQNLVFNNMISIPLKKMKFNNDIIISEDYYKYKAFENFYRLEKVYTSKGNHINIESDLVYSINEYDSKGNVLETQQNEDGLKTSYIYGYNKSLPVAKLENVAYASIDASLIQQIQNTTNEDELLSLFNTLRNNHPQGLITTYIHIPLVGISKVIDPNGKVINYYYDEFNRLSRVTDSENNPVTDYEYHYKTL